MLTNFEKDRQAAKQAELIVLKFLQNTMNDYTYIDVSESTGCLLKGDICAQHINGAQIFIEVKDDSCIANTHNVLVESSVLYHSSGYDKPYNNTADIYAVVSQIERKIYFFNHNKLKKLAKFAPERIIRHEEQTTYCNLVALSEAARAGALIGTITY